MLAISHQRFGTALLVVTLLFLASAASQAKTSFPAIGELKQYSPEFASVIKPGTKIEKLTEDKFQWAEGPAWVPSNKQTAGYLLADDVPKNIMYRWSEKDGLTVFLQPSGLEKVDVNVFREPGANGLFVESATTLLSADSGNRRITRINLINKKKTSVVSTYQGKKFNSPNDVIKSSKEIIYFTDPPYGLKEMEKSPARELKFSGVYRVARDGSVSVIDDSLLFPNGIALSPDEHTLYVSDSDPANPIWMAYTLDDKGMVVSKREFANAKDLAAAKLPGLPDGMKVAKDGHIFAAAPGGILVMNAKGERLGMIVTGTTVANCAFGDDGSTLYMTSSNFLARVKLAIKAR